MTDACVGSRVVVVATTSRARDLSAVVTAAFVHQVGMESPSEEQRHIMLGSLSQKLSMGMDVNLEKLSKLTMVNDYPAVDPDQVRIYQQLCGASRQLPLITSKITE